MEFFRPNIVIANSEPLDEGQWENIRIGDAVFSVLSPDARFIQQNFDVVNQDWRYQVEYFKPLGQLITLPASCYNASYGVLAKVIQEGDINVGDPVYVTYRL
ncbi:uncharacterized protein YcbX-like [Physella acuta]|uniref:uncharacterized protein YcbX-like n=1 Tax=Physella acuta TaxID=109671 RepID=UPI0027DBE136|nr:uncharacterized protein YcbX-like [Physella acuta]